MNGLRELLSDVADQARTYEVTDRAVRAAGRRARVHRYAPVAALVAVALLAVGVWLPLRPSGGGPSLDAGPVPWLPETVSAPAQPPPPLGPDRRVGSGSLLYRVGEEPGTILVTSNGRLYTVPDGDDRGALSLSPDGRWLLLDAGGRLVVQDLRDGGRREVSGKDPSWLTLRWSPNGRWLALADTASQTTVSLVDVTTWQTTSSRPHTDAMLLAVLDSGEILIRDAGGGPLTLEHPSGAARTLSPRPDGVLRPGETLDQPSPDTVLSDGDNLFMRAWVAWATAGSGGTVSDDLLVLDAGSGIVLRRVVLPDPVAGDPAGDAFDLRESAAVAPEGILLRHRLLSGSVDLELLDPRTGALTAATRAEGGATDLRPRGYAG